MFILIKVLNIFKIKFTAEDHRCWCAHHCEERRVFRASRRHYSSNFTSNPNNTELILLDTSRTVQIDGYRSLGIKLLVENNGFKSQSDDGNCLSRILSDESAVQNGGKRHLTHREENTIRLLEGDEIANI